ncbi:type II secretory pathway [Striga asiatica]|uniref:Type II secretory pathway n=1 Tax=Striga asiatica TaxID=4170 RepID=A0A5A7Q286_STRAF|nr:type II secretory pathway [Striga asiatica]
METSPHIWSNPYFSLKSLVGASGSRTGSDEVWFSPPNESIRLVHIGPFHEGQSEPKVLCRLFCLYPCGQNKIFSRDTDDAIPAFIVAEVVVLIAWFASSMVNTENMNSLSALDHRIMAKFLSLVRPPMRVHQLISRSDIGEQKYNWNLSPASSGEGSAVSAFPSDKVCEVVEKMKLIHTTEFFLLFYCFFRRKKKENSKHAEIKVRRFARTNRVSEHVALSISGANKSQEIKSVHWHFGGSIGKNLLCIS